jgi:FkbH-like protein
MLEPVRLVIWDLDETFWSGTLTEGGIQFVDAHKHIVIELVRRGIVSSICSKNDHTKVEAILREHEIWDYFIFPSINWEPKGPRIAAMIETIGLRPPTVLFIDDNPMNRHEALHFTNDIQVSDESIVPQLLSDPRLTGKDDASQNRLKQYKVLEKRRREQTQAPNTSEFLRASNIRVYIEHDVEQHIDRAVELINRTNQLNFTKRRLQEGEDGRNELLARLAKHNVNPGLVRVVDNYGDYGYCGLFLVENLGTERRLEHFCFSCRTIGMGIEAYIYNRLGRPSLTILGEILSDPIGDDDPDWIVTTDTPPMVSTVSPKTLPPIYLRGGCDLMQLAHYAGLESRNVFGDFNITRHGIHLRLDHSVVGRHAALGLPQNALRDFQALGYQTGDFSLPTEAAHKDATWILSFSPDFWVPLYHHRDTGTKIPFVFQNTRGVVMDPLLIPEADRIAEIPEEATRAKVTVLSDRFESCGLTSEIDFKENLRAILSRRPPKSPAFIIAYPEFQIPGRSPAPHVVEINRWASDIAAEEQDVYILRMVDFVETEDELLPYCHVKRSVHSRIFAAVKRTIS